MIWRSLSRWSLALLLSAPLLACNGGNHGGGTSGAGSGGVGLSSGGGGSTGGGSAVGGGGTSGGRGGGNGGGGGPAGKGSPMTLPDIRNFSTAYLGYDARSDIVSGDGPANWEALGDYFKPQCGDTVCVKFVRRAVEADQGGSGCGFVRAVPSRTPYYRGDVVYIEVKAPCPLPGDSSGGTPPGGDNAGGQDEGQDGGQDAGQDGGGQDAGQDGGGQQDVGGAVGGSPGDSAPVTASPS